VRLTNHLYKTILSLWNIIPLKKEILLLVKKLNFPIEKIKNDLWFEGIFTVTLGDFKVLFNQTRYDKVTYSVFWDGLENGWDAMSLKVWLRLVKRSKIVLDIGANIGIYSIAAMKANENVSIFSFEPSKEIINILERNLSLNNISMNVIPVALSNRDGTGTFYDSDVPNAAASLKAIDSSTSSNSYNVEVKRWDSLCITQTIDLLIMDVERNELEVLEGMVQMINKDMPNMIIEILDNEIGTSIQQFFKPFNYEFYHIDERRGLLKVEHLQIPINASPHSRNFLICRQNTIDLLKDLLIIDNGR
jgi:FkbM family methyltransferase